MYSTMTKAWRRSTAHRKSIFKPHTIKKRTSRIMWRCSRWSRFWNCCQFATRRLCCTSDCRQFSIIAGVTVNAVPPLTTSKISQMPQEKQQRTVTRLGVL